MSRSVAENSLADIENLVHAVAGLAHVEKLTLESRTKVHKLQTVKGPFDKELSEAKAKLEMWQNNLKNLESWTLHWFLHWVTCEVAAEKARCAKGIKKSEELVAEAQKKVDAVEEDIRNIEVPNEKNAIDYRSLQNYRDELTLLLDSVFVEGDFPTEKELRQQKTGLQERLNKVKEDAKNIEKAKSLLQKADLALLEAIVDLRQSNDDKNIGEGRVYFPQRAYDAIKEARELCPELPGIPAPESYVNKPDDTGAYYSPMQKYLWEVRHGLANLITWCDEQSLEHVDLEAEVTAALGAKIDEWNMERRRLIKEVILSS